MITLLNPGLKKRASRTLATILITGSCLIICGGILHYRIQKSRLLRNTTSELHTLTEMKSNDMAMWHDLWYNSAEQARHNIFVQREIATFIHQRKMTHPDLICYLSGQKYRKGVDEPWLVDSKGICLIPEKNAGEIIPPAAERALHDAFKTKHCTASGLSHYQGEADRIYAVTPYFDTQTQEPIAAIIRPLNPLRELSLIFSKWPKSLGMTPRTVLINQVDSICRIYEYGDSAIRMHLLTLCGENALNDYLRGGYHSGYLNWQKDPDEKCLTVSCSVPESTSWFVAVTIPDHFIAAKLAVIKFEIILYILFLLFLFGICLYLVILKNEKDDVGETLKTRNTQLAKTRHYELLMQEANDIMFLFDAQYEMIEFNQRAGMIFGISKPDLSRIRLENLFAAEDISRLFAYLEDVRTGSIGLLEIKAKRIDGSFFPIELNARMIHINCKPFIQIIGRDITERNRVETALRNSEENLRVVLKSITESIITVNTTGNITLMNPSAEKLSGHLFKNVVGKPLEQIICLHSPIDSTLAVNPVHDALQRGIPIILPLPLLLTISQDRFVTVAVSAAPLRNQEKNVGAVLVMRDVSQEQKSEETVRQNQKMEAIGQLAGGIAHDFNNMLTSILGACELLQNKQIPDTTTTKYIAIIADAAAHAESITKKLLAFSSKNTYARCRLRIRELIDTVCRTLQQDIPPSVKIRTHQFERELIITGDRTSLQNAILNIACNGIAAMPEGGVLTLATAVKYINENELVCGCSHAVAGSYVHISISNTGKPIPQDVLPRIFEPFFTTKPTGSGTGLGLCASYNIVREHHGVITASSREHLTTFNIYIPLSDTCELETAEPPADQSRMICGKGTVLVVDDEPIVRTVAKEVLSAAGYNVILAEDGLVGIEICRRRKAEISLILLDMMMPRCDGPTAFKQFHASAPEIPVVIASGYDRTESADTLLQNGAAAFIAKPYRVTSLTQTIHDIIITHPKTIS